MELIAGFIWGVTAVLVLNALCHMILGKRELEIDDSTIRTQFAIAILGTFFAALFQTVIV